jgi:hypothetical protein
MFISISASDRNEYHKQKNMFVGSTARAMLRTDNLTAACGQIVYTDNVGSLKSLLLSLLSHCWSYSCLFDGRCLVPDLHVII